jgi:hypothetical protein
LKNDKRPVDRVRDIYWSVNLCLAILCAIFLVEIVGEIRALSEHREDRSHDQMCEAFAKSDYPMPDSCR